MFKGLRTVIYHVNDLERATKWYTEVLGVPPYFNEPYYVGFNVGGFELGLDPNLADPTYGNATHAYWGVSDVQATYDRLISLGASSLEEVQDVGGGITVATVRDPWGNVLGIIDNPHFKREDVR